MEEKLKIPRLNHEQPVLYKVFGLTAYQKAYVKLAIIFETYSNALLASELYDNPDEIPADLSTASSVLEKALNHLRNSSEQMFGILIFQETYHRARVTLASLKEQDKPADSGEKEDLKSIVKKLVVHIQAEPVKQAMMTIKEVGFDFEKFIEKVLPLSQAAELEAIEEKIQNGDMKLDLDDFLRGDDSED